MVLNPERFDVIVAFENLFGDILLRPLRRPRHHGIAASGNINPERTAPHLRAGAWLGARHRGRKIANPIATICPGALMLEHLGIRRPRPTSCARSSASSSKAPARPI